MALELTSVANIQDYLGDTSISSTTLTTMANAAEARIARYCNRYDEVNFNHWLSASRTEYIDGEDFPHVLLRWTPITAISSVVQITGASTSVTVTLTDLECDGIAIASLAAGNTTQGNAGRLGWRTAAPALVASWFDSGLPAPSVLSYTRYPGFVAGRSRVKAVYTGGFSAAPSDLALAATMLAAKMYRERTRDPALVAERLGDYSRQWRDGPSEDQFSLGDVADLLSAYRRPVA